MTLADQHPATPRNPLFRLFTFWTDNDVALLRCLARQGAPVGVIARRLYRSPDSIRMKAALLNIKVAAKRPALLDVDLAGIGSVPAFEHADFILGRVAETYSISVDLIRTHSRDADLVQARQHAVHLIAKLTKLSMPQMARIVGLTDHTTILHSIRIMNDRTGENVRGVGGVPERRILAWQRCKAAKKAARLANAA